MLWRRVHKALGTGRIRPVQMRLPARDYRFRLSAVDHVRREESDPPVMVLAVVPADEFGYQNARLLDACEALRKLGAVLEGFELRLRVGIVV